MICDESEAIESENAFWEQHAVSVTVDFESVLKADKSSLEKDDALCLSEEKGGARLFDDG